MARSLLMFLFFVLMCACYSSLAVASPYSDAVLADGPIAYYRLNETAGTTAANGGTAGALLDGTFIGYGAAAEGSGPINIGQSGPRPGDSSGAASITGLESDNRAIHSAINFTAFPTAGENPRVEVADFADNPLDILGALTLEAWVYRDPQTDGFGSNNEGIVGKFIGSGNQRAYGLSRRADTGELRFILSRFGTYEGAFDFPSPQNAIPLGEWTHVAATYVPSTRMAIFVNGLMVAEQTNPDNVPGFLFNSDAPLWIGTQHSELNPLTAWEGKIDEVAVYNRALSDDTIMAHYRAGVVPEPSMFALGTAATACLFAFSRRRIHSNG